MKTSTLVFLAVGAYFLWPKSASAKPAAKGPLPTPPKPRQGPLPTPPKPRTGPTDAGRQPPPGYTEAEHGEGFHGEQAALFWYPDGSLYVIPDDPSLAPYRETHVARGH